MHLRNYFPGYLREDPSDLMLAESNAGYLINMGGKEHSNTRFIYTRQVVESEGIGGHDPNDHKYLNTIRVQCIPSLIQ